MKPYVKMTMGDVVLTQRKKGFIGRLIRRFSRTPGEEKTNAEHVAIAVNESRLVEATFKGVVTSHIGKYDTKKYKIRVARARIEYVKRLALKRKAYSYSVKSYGFFKIGLHAMDWFASGVAGKEVFFFRKMAKNNKYPICSWLVAWCYDSIGMDFGKPKEYVQPDDIDDCVVKDKEWTIIYDDFGAEGSDED